MSKYAFANYYLIKQFYCLWNSFLLKKFSFKFFLLLFIFSGTFQTSGYEIKHFNLTESTTVAPAQTNPTTGDMSAVLAATFKWFHIYQNSFAFTREVWSDIVLLQRWPFSKLFLLRPWRPECPHAQVEAKLISTVSTWTLNKTSQ